MLGLCAILSAGVAAIASDRASAQTFAVTRYDDDVSALALPANRSGTYEALKFIPLGSDSGSFLSLGGDERERIEAVRNRLLGFRLRGSNAYVLHRTLLFADLHMQEARFFVQAGNDTEYGRAPAAIPTDIDRGDLQQAFFDYAIPLDRGTLTARGGRAEMAFDEGALIGLRDGTNVRQSWDGARFFYISPELRVDLFAVRPVNVTPGYFDDRDLARQTLWGVHTDYAPTALQPVTFNAFYYGNIMPSVNLAPRSGPEETHTFGLRARATAASLDGSVGVIGQTGSFAGRPVAAFAAHADIGWTLPLAWSPRLGLRGDVLSGGDNAHGTIHTFNALYPNVAYSTEATVEAPANLIQPGLTLRFNPLPEVTVQCTLEGLWRYSTHDAFYAAPLFPLVQPDGSHRRFSGQEQQIEFAWRLKRFVTLTVAYAHFEAGAFIRAAHGTNQDFGLAQVAVHF